MTIEKILCPYCHIEDDKEIDSINIDGNVMIMQATCPHCQRVMAVDAEFQWVNYRIRMIETPAVNEEMSET